MLVSTLNNEVNLCPLDLRKEDKAIMEMMTVVMADKDEDAMIAINLNDVKDNVEGDRIHPPRQQERRRNEVEAARKMVVARPPTRT